MKLIFIAMFLTGLAAAAFIAGITTQATIPMFASFCAWTPIAWFSGWALAKSGISINISSGGGYAAPVSNHQPPSSLVANGDGRPPRRREPRREEFQ